MALIDEATIQVIAGAGGNGCVSFRREKYVPYGGPNGGNGGDGGSVILTASHDKGSLLDFKFRPEFKAERGEHGMGKDMFGRRGENIELKVPLGTRVLDKETGAMLADLVEDGDRYVAAEGGRGGRGNLSFKSSTNRAPKTAEPGEPGQTALLKLELRLIADVGLVGLPNAGKSSFLASVTRANPKIAAYPFTTLEPQLGVGHFLDQAVTFADLPGLIEGAAQGVGLGIRFLKHVSRNRLLLHLVECNVGADEIEKRLTTVQAELAAYDEALTQVPQILVFTKADLVDETQRHEIETELTSRGITGFFYSSATHFGEVPLLEAISRTLYEARVAEAAAKAASTETPDVAEGADTVANNVTFETETEDDDADSDWEFSKPPAKSTAPSRPLGGIV